MNKFSNKNTNRTYDSEKGNLGRFSEASPNHNQRNNSQNSSNNSQQRNHFTSLSPYKEKIKSKSNQTTNNNRQIVSVFKIPFNHDLTPLTKDKEIIAKNIVINNPYAINDTNFGKLSGLTNNGEITPAVNQATEILPKISDADFRWPIDNLFTNNKSITKLKLCQNHVR